MADEREKTIEQAALEERRAYYREWRAKNPDKVREYQSRYWKKKAEKHSEGER